MTNATVLIASADPALAGAAARALAGDAVHVAKAGTGEEASAILAALDADLLIAAAPLPDMSGGELAAVAREARSSPEVILLTDRPGLTDTEAGLLAGAAQVLSSSLDPERLRHEVVRVLKARRVRRRSERFRERWSEATGDADEASLVGKSEAMRVVYHQIVLAAQTWDPVLIEGETGTGKELVAQAIHEATFRRIGAGKAPPFVRRDVGASSPELLASELFGHERGAFTGAMSERPGAFLLARGGTLLLDEISNLPHEAQPKLLRALQEREVLPVGATEPESTDARILAATNQNLDRMVAEGTFRSDLLFRLRVFTIEVPPLRARMEDLQDLVRHLLRRIGRERSQSEVPKLDPKAWEKLRSHSWPGNVRELENCLRAASARTIAGVILADMLEIHRETQGSGANPATGAAVDAGPGGSGTLRGHQPTAPTSWVAPDGRLLTWDEGRRAHIEAALLLTDGNVTRAGELLGVPRSTLQRWISELKAKPPE